MRVPRRARDVRDTWRRDKGSTWVRICEKKPELAVGGGVVRELGEDEALRDGETPDTVMHFKTTRRDNVPRGARREVNLIARC